MILKSVMMIALAAGSTNIAAHAQSAPASDSAPAAPIELAQASPAPSPADKPYGPTPEQLKLLEQGGRLSQSVFARDNITVGFGAGLVPSYEGSDQYVLFPLPVVRGSYKGYSFSARGVGLFVDLIKDVPLAKVQYIAGPVVRARLERVTRIQDDVVARLGKRNVALEVGASGGITINRIFGNFDSLTFQADATADISGAHDGVIVTPSVSYTLPIKTAGAITLTGSGEFTDNNYADYYYSINAAGRATSGLPLFRADGGLKSLGATVFGVYDLSGNALDGGWAVFAVGGYTRLQDDFADSPIVSIRGDADQFFGGAGLTYTF